MKSLKEKLNESLNEAKKIKAFKDVKIGDVAVDIDTLEPLGEIQWKGLWKDAKNNRMSSVSEWEDLVKDGLITQKELDSIEFVVVKDPNFGNDLMSYNFDPSSAAVLK